MVERTSSWQAKLAHKKLVWCTERRGRVIDFWVTFSEVIIIVRRLIREGWTRYRWEGVPLDGHDLSAEPLSSTYSSPGSGFRLIYASFVNGPHESSST